MPVLAGVEHWLAFDTGPYLPIDVLLTKVLILSIQAATTGISFLIPPFAISILITLTSRLIRLTTP